MTGFTTSLRLPMLDSSSAGSLFKPWFSAIQNVSCQYRFKTRREYKVLNVEERNKVRGGYVHIFNPRNTNLLLPHVPSASFNIWLLNLPSLRVRSTQHVCINWSSLIYSMNWYPIPLGKCSHSSAFTLISNSSAWTSSLFSLGVARM